MSKQRYGLWTRRRDITTGRIQTQGAWLSWSCVKVFDEEELSNQQQWARTNQSQDRQYDIRPEAEDSPTQI